MALKDFKYASLFDIYGDLLSEKQKYAIEMYYFDDLSLAEIAEHMGITRQGVRDQIKHAEEELDRFENALGLYTRSTVATSAEVDTDNGKTSSNADSDFTEIGKQNLLSNVLLIFDRISGLNSVQRVLVERIINSNNNEERSGCHSSFVSLSEYVGGLCENAKKLLSEYCTEKNSQDK